MTGLRRRFANADHQSTYDALRNMRPDPETYRGMGGGGNAYAVGYTMPDTPNRAFPRGSKAYAHWVAGVDNARDDASGLTPMTPPVTQAATDLAEDFLASWPRVTMPSYIKPALVQAFAKAIAEETARVSRLLTDYAAVLRTKEGRRKAEWAEQDAEMVANELDRQATAIRATVGEVGNG